MSIISILIVLLIVVFILWIVNTQIALPPNFKTIFNVAVVIILFLWILKVLGLWSGGLAL